MTGAVSSSAGAPTYAIDGTGGSAMSAPMKYDGCGGWLYAEFCPATPTRYCESCISVGMRSIRDVRRRVDPDAAAVGQPHRELLAPVAEQVGLQRRVALGGVVRQRAVEAEQLDRLASSAGSHFEIVGTPEAFASESSRGR